MSTVIYKSRAKKSPAAVLQARAEFLQVRKRKERELAAQAKIRTQLLKGRLIDKEEFFAQLAPIFMSLRRSFETLLLTGVPEGVVNEMLATLERVKTIQSNGNGRDLGSAGSTGAAQKAT